MRHIDGLHTHSIKKNGYGYSGGIDAQLEQSGSLVQKINSSYLIALESVCILEVPLVCYCGCVAVEKHTTCIDTSACCSIQMLVVFFIKSEDEKSTIFASIILDCHICLELSIKVFKLTFEVFSSYNHTWMSQQTTNCNIRSNRLVGLIEIFSVHVEDAHDIFKHMHSGVSS